jgi:hypothetical protein
MKKQGLGPGSARRSIKIFAYVVEHDEGREPSPYFDVCTLCRCKYSKKAEGRKAWRAKNICAGGHV